MLVPGKLGPVFAKKATIILYIGGFGLARNTGQSWKGLSGANPIKLFTAVICGFFNKLVFVPGKPFQPSLMFVGKARDSSRGKHLNGGTLG